MLQKELQRGRITISIKFTDKPSQTVQLNEEAIPTPTPIPERVEKRPDVVILSLPVQDALALKWARDVGINMNLVLRAQGDRTVFVTTSVTLPQIVEQGGLTIPEVGTVGLEPRADEVSPPSLPPKPPGE